MIAWSYRLARGITRLTITGNSLPQRWLPCPKSVKGKKFLMSKKRFAIVGTGSRAAMFIDAICGTYADSTELVALCDLSQVRMNFYNRHLETAYQFAPVPTYPATQFEQMIRETKPDTVIVATMDATHHQYIIE